SAGLTAGSGTTTVSIPIVASKGVKTYTAVLKVTDGDVTVNIPLTLEVNAPANYIASVNTFIDGATTKGALPAGETIQLKQNDAATVIAADATSANGTYVFKNLEWAKTYTVYVNGYATGTTTVNNTATIGTTWDVKDLYTVDFAADTYTGGAPTIKTVPTLAGAAVITVKPTDAGVVVPGGGTVDLAAAPSTSTPFYRFAKWQDKKGTGTLADTNPVMTENGTYTVGTANTDATAATAPVALAPSYTKQYKITMEVANSDYSAAAPKADAAAPVGDAATTIMVDDGSYVDLSSTDVSGYYFQKWLADNVTGKFDAITAAGDLGIVKAGKYTPAADTTITLHLWKDAALAAGFTYDIGAPIAANPNPEVKWTANDASTPSKIEYKLSTDLDTAYATLAAANYTEASGVYTLKADFLKSLAVATYTVRFTYDLGTVNNVRNDLTKTADFTITATAATLTSVTVKESKGAATVKVGGTVVYSAHTPNTITKENKLTYQWYTSTAKPTQAKGSTLPAGAVAQGSPETEGTYTVLPADAGKYVFAVVTASVTGEGKVVTNGVPVNYNGIVKINVDGAGTAISTNHANYKVYLWDN
ncbi:MAG: hypothetical protein RSB55_08645, partial [Oscillospiraceae bacterium]